MAFDILPRKTIIVSKRLLDSNRLPWSYIPEGWNLHQRRCDDPKSLVNTTLVGRQVE
jgi:hypothetical protein